MTVATEALSEYDFILVVDASGSMTTADMPGGRTRWEAMQETAQQFARDISKIDSDGIGLVIFNGQTITTQDGVGPDEVRLAFESRNPRSSTPLAGALTAALGLAGKSPKKDFILVFTDGEPDDKQAVVDVIRKQANKQETDEDLTFLFVQVGRDARATAFLKMLDDDLKGAKFDIVDVKTMDEAEAFNTTAELIVAAIDD